MADSVPKEIWSTHICTKIPSKGLLRCKLVCKEWGDILSDLTSEISDLHDHVIVRIHEDCSSYSVVYDKNSGAWTHIPSVVTVVNQLRIKYIIGSSNGLLCCAVYPPNSPSEIEKLAIWNLSTGDFRLIPNRLGFKRKNTFYFGFYYDFVNNDANIVCIKTRRTGKLQICIYSMKSNSWDQKEKEDYARYFPEDESARNNSKACGMNGSIYWITRVVDCNTLEQVIVFNIKEHKFSAIPMPWGWIYNQKSYHSMVQNLTVIGGSLGLSQKTDYCEQHRFRLWTLKQGGNEWSKLIAIDIPRFTLLRPICLTKCQKIVMTYHVDPWMLHGDLEETRIMLYDLMSGKIPHLHIGDPTRYALTTLPFVEAIHMQASH